jgi:hypothetical protein
MADVTLAEIEDVFIADGGVFARKLHGSIIEGFAINDDTTVKPMVEQLAGVDHPLRSDKFAHWDQVILMKANKDWKEGLRDFRANSLLPHPQVTRYAVPWWLAQLLPELKQSASDDLGLPNEHVMWQSRSRTDAASSPSAGMRSTICASCSYGVCRGWWLRFRLAPGCCS